MLAGLSRSADPEPSQRERGGGVLAQGTLGCVGKRLKVCAALTGSQTPSLPPVAELFSNRTPMGLCTPRHSPKVW